MGSHPLASLRRAGQAWAEPTCHEDSEQAADRRTGHAQDAGGTITTLAARQLPQSAGPPAAYQIRSSLPRSGRLTSDMVVNPPDPNSSWVCILTDSVWVPAANVTVSWPSTSGST
jgi:hypothetical protein